MSRVEVTQTFTNPFDHPLEAVYKFPLPDEAAVDDMEIKLDDRIIRGVIKKRQEAKQIYEKAKKAGKTAGLLEQERANVFTQSLANIKPGESIQVTIRYTDSLKFEGGDYEFAFPMVVAPRYTAGNSVGSAKALTTNKALMTNSVGSKHFSASSAKALTTNKALMTNSVGSKHFSASSAKAPTTNKALMTNSVGSKHFRASSAKAPTTNKALMTNSVGSKHFRASSALSLFRDLIPRIRLQLLILPIVQLSYRINR